MCVCVCVFVCVCVAGFPAGLLDVSFFGGINEEVFLPKGPQHFTPRFNRHFKGFPAGLLNASFLEVLMR